MQVFAAFSQTYTTVSRSDLVEKDLSRVVH